MKKVIILVLVALIAACASETEQKSLDKIAANYGAKTTYSKNFKSAVGQETMRAFTINVSESKLIDSLNPNVSSANIALMAYETFTQEEKDNYTDINVNLINLKKDSANYTFQTNVLSEISKKSVTFYTFAKSLVDRDFGTIDKIKDATEIKGTVAQGVKNLIEKNEKIHGNLLSYQTFGLSEAQDEKGSAYQFQGFLIFEKGKKIPFVGAVDALPEKNKLIGFNIFDDL